MKNLSKNKNANPRILIFCGSFHVIHLSSFHPLIKMRPMSLSLCTILLPFLYLQICSIASKSTDPSPSPSPWPLQFHSVLFMNNSGTLQKLDLWYDWPNGRNFNIIQNQLGTLKYDLEWNNGTSYIYTLDSNKECRVLHFSVGILHPNWLDGATYLGQEHVDGFLCNVWTKVDFIWYYEDVVTKRPVHWLFFNGYSAHVMTFEVGAVLEEPHWQAPVYCFGKEKRPLLESLVTASSFGNLLEMFPLPL